MIFFSFLSLSLNSSGTRKSEPQTSLCVLDSFNEYVNKSNPDAIFKIAYSVVI